MELTEQRIYEAFDLGEEAQEAADPAQTQTEATGEEAQEVADPAGTTDNADTAGSGEGADAPESTEGEKEPQTPEQRRENAARRRQAETQAAINKAVQDALQEERKNAAAQQKAFFEKANLKNTITGEPITNMEQFDAWSEAFANAKLQRELKAGKLTPEALQTAIGNHPAIRQAQQLIQQRQDQEKAAKQTEAKSKIDQEIAEIHKIDASINSVADLFQAPYGKELYDMTKRGYSIKDAHFLLNYERLEQAKLEAAKQQGARSARSKDHLAPTGGQRGGGAASVPQAEMDMFRQFNPNASDTEIQNYYNNYVSKQGG